MSTAAALIILAIVAVMAALLAADYFGRRPKKAANPDCTAEVAWEHYVSHADLWSDRDRRAIDGLGADSSAGDLMAELERIVSEALSASDPVAVLRVAVMDATDRFMMLETVVAPQVSEGEASGTDVRSEDAAAILEAGSLRCFSMLRFGDYGDDDWYTHYLRVAEMNARNVAVMVQKTVRGELSSLETSLHEPLTQAMREAREVLVHHPPQTPVDRATKLAVGHSAARRSPSQKQIGNLTGIMSERFERIFSGQAYLVEGSSPVTPVTAFQVDAALLYTVLSHSFTQPSEAWCRILDKSLGEASNAFENEQKLLEMALEVRQVWQDHRRQGPLNAALRVACERALVDGDSSDRPDIEAIVGAMNDDASRLVGAIQGVLREQA